MHISKEGDPYLRTLLVQGEIAHRCRLYANRAVASSNCRKQAISRFERQSAILSEIAIFRQMLAPKPGELAKKSFKAETFFYGFRTPS